jgi:type IV pilus assembly protein PilA
MKKTNNKGFSLVELIIVIAIMAILIGVLAPQYIKYVEKSRISADKDTIDSLTKAVQTACTDDDYYDTLSAGNKVDISKTNGIVTTGAALQSAIDEFYGTKNGTDSNKKFKSKAFDGTTATIQIVEVTNSATKAKSLQASVYTTGTVKSNPYDPASFK